MKCLLVPASTAILLLYGVTAHATLTCIPLEYAVYKDRAKTSSGRRMLALDACAARRRADLPTATTASARDCERTVETITAALANARDAQTSAFVRDGCEGDYNKVRVK